MAEQTWRGRKCKDVVSGWAGVAVARYDYINGCIRYEIAGTDKDGKPEGFVVDEQQIEWADKYAKGFEPTASTPIRSATREHTTQPAIRSGSHDHPREL